MSEKIENQIVDSFPDEETCIRHLEKIRWNGIVVSPFSTNSKVYYCAEGKYKCRDTGKYFNVKTGTIFHNSRIGLQKWFAAIWIMAIERNSITSVDMAKELNITQKTAWYMMQRIREYFNLKKTRSYHRKTKTPTYVKDAEAIEVIVDADKLKMIDWLNMLKK
jgi:transposase-like protein